MNNCLPSEFFKGSRSRGLRIRSEQKLTQYVPQFNSLNESDLQYLAGIIDAEGTILRVVQKNGWADTLIIQIVNTNEDVLLHTKAKLGVGNISCLTRDHTRKQLFTWNCSLSEFSLRLLDMVAPYLLVKNQQVEHALLGKFSQSPMSWAYVAGFLDGDGSVTFTKTRYGIYPAISIKQKKRGVLVAIRNFVGVGAIYRTQRGSRYYYAFQFTEHESVKTFAESTVPYSIINKRKLNHVIRIVNRKYREHPLQHVTGSYLVRRIIHGSNMNQLAREFGVYPNSIFCKIQNAGLTVPKPCCSKTMKLY